MCEVEIDHAKATYIKYGGYFLHLTLWDRQKNLMLITFDRYTDKERNFKAAK